MNASAISSRVFTLAYRSRICTYPTRYASSRLWSQGHRCFTTSQRTRSERFRPYYVTTPIFYVNAGSLVFT